MCTRHNTFKVKSDHFISAGSIEFIISSIVPDFNNKVHIPVFYRYQSKYFILMWHTLTDIKISMSFRFKMYSK